MVAGETGHGAAAGGAAYRKVGQAGCQLHGRHSNQLVSGNTGVVHSGSLALSGFAFRFPSTRPFDLKRHPGSIIIVTQVRDQYLIRIHHKGIP